MKHIGRDSPNLLHAWIFNIKCPKTKINQTMIIMQALRPTIPWAYDLLQALVSSFNLVQRTNKNGIKQSIQTTKKQLNGFTQRWLDDTTMVIFIMLSFSLTAPNGKCSTWLQIHTHTQIKKYVKCIGMNAYAGHQTLQLCLPI